MPISTSTYMVAKHCPICGVEFMTEVSYSMCIDGHLTIIKAADSECPDCATWAGVELMVYHLMHNMDA